MFISNKIHVKGKWFLELIDKCGNVFDSTPLRCNLILDQGLDFMATRSEWARYCHVGSSTVAPSVGQTALLGYIDRVPSSSTTYENRTANSIDVKQVFEFPAGTATGVITELGLGGDLNTALATRTLVRDSGGNPYPRFKGPEDTMRITYYLTYTYPTGDLAWSFLTNAVTYSGVVRGANIDNYLPNILSPNTIKDIALCTGAIGTVDEEPTGTKVAPSSVVYLPYVVGEYTRKANVTYSASAGNGLDIISVGWRDELSQWQASISPAVEKDNTFKLEFTVETSWDRG